MGSWTAALLSDAIFLAAVVLLAVPTGHYLARVFDGKGNLLGHLMRPIELALYRVAAVNPEEEQDWKGYVVSFLVFSFIGTVALYAVLRLQVVLPGSNAQVLTTPLTPDLALNTAISFLTTTTWQAYAGETTLSYASQMALCASNFLAGAAGLAVGIAFIRGLAREKTGRIGNFWVDLIRSLLYVLLPASLVGGILLILVGVPMNFLPDAAVTTVEGARQLIAQGPVASLEIIKNLGTNGGGFFNSNAAHPFETPNNAANVLNLLAIAGIPAALTRTFGIMTDRRREGWVLLAVMVVLFGGGLAVCDKAERDGNPRIIAAHVAGPNMEGKETRFGIQGSMLAAVTTSNGATGSTTAAADSFTPMGSLVPLTNMLLGEIVFGGLGTGLYSMVMVAVTGLFMCGLMVGRTPDFIGKPIQKFHIQMVVLYMLAGPLFVLGLSALALVTRSGLAGLTTNGGAHGYTEIVFAYASCFANNGQAMAGLSSNSVFYNVTTIAAMIGGRFFLAVPALAMAGEFARDKRRPVTTGTLPTDGTMFAIIILVTALLLTLLSYLPALALGPIVEHLQLYRR